MTDVCTKESIAVETANANSTTSAAPANPCGAVPTTATKTMTASGGDGDGGSGSGSVGGGLSVETGTGETNVQTVSMAIGASINANPSVPASASNANSNSNLNANMNTTGKIQFVIGSKKRRKPSGFVSSTSDGNGKAHKRINLNVLGGDNDDETSTTKSTAFFNFDDEDDGISNNGDGDEKNPVRASLNRDEGSSTAAIEPSPSFGTDDSNDLIKNQNSYEDGCGDGSRTDDVIMHEQNSQAPSLEPQTDKELRIEAEIQTMVTKMQKDTPPSSPNTNQVQTPIHHVHSPVNSPTTNFSSSSTSSPSSSSTSSSPTPTLHSPTTSSSSLQPDGWRVKLYRLNADGSWDDCGTGRIVCLQQQPSQQRSPSKGIETNANSQSQINTDTAGNQNGKGGESTSSGDGNKTESLSNSSMSSASASAETNTDSGANADGDADCTATTTTSTDNGKSKGPQQDQTQTPVLTQGKEWVNLEEEIYQALGEPTLCMHAEVPANGVGKLTNAHFDLQQKPKVLLRTRVLLRESYQRQGDNIITWCEPFFLPAAGRNSGIDENGKNSSGGNGNVNTNTNGNRSRTNEEGDDIANIHDNDLTSGVDLALSFQENTGCRDIWNKISKIQHKAYELFEAKGGLPIDNEEGLGDMALTHQLNQQQQRHRRHQQDGIVGGVVAGGMDNDGTKDHALSNENSSRGATGDNDTGVLDDGKSTMQNETREHQNVGVGSRIHADAQHSNLSIDDSHHKIWGNNNPADGVRVPHSHTDCIDVIDAVDEHDFMEAEAAAVSVAAQYVGSGQIGAYGKNLSMNQGDSMAKAQLPNPPSLGNLEEIADIIAASLPQQREAIAVFASQAECAYLKALLALFPSTEKKNDYHALATLASIIKSIILFNEPAIIQLVASDANIFQECCSCLEYDPDLREKANHRWFIRDRLKFRTVLRMEDQGLIDSIHKAFRVTYVRDTLLRPTMDESSLSTLGSLLTFTHADVVKGVMCAPRNKNATSIDSYLVRILRLLGKEIRAIRESEWAAIEEKGRRSHKNRVKVEPSVCTTTNQTPASPWSQHLTPQDDSLQSRKVRRKGCLSFLREMFNMVRMSLQQSDKDDFYAMIVLMDVKLKEGPKKDSALKECDGNDNKATEPDDTVNLLSLLGAILADINADVSERGACLEILSAIAMHEPSLIRKHCLEEFASSKENQKPGLMTVTRPEPDGQKQVVFVCPPTDLLLSLLYVMATDNDAGIMLQTCEVIRIIMDTEMANDPSQFDLGGVIDNEEDELIGSDNAQFIMGSNAPNGHNGGGCEQNSFLQMFYDHYVPWLVAPFQYSMLVPKSAIPFSLRGSNQKCSLLDLLMKKHKHLKDAKISRTGLLKNVSISPMRLSFSVELLSFCVRAHCYKMRRFLINSRVLINVIKLTSPKCKMFVPSSDRCLKLGALRCLRSIISLKDEFYNRHIIQHSLFTPVFEGFRANPVGDNLVSSSIIEICEFIRTENIKSLIEYIVTKHMSQNPTTNSGTSPSGDSLNKPPPSLEDVATPYVDTLTLLRQKHEDNVNSSIDGVNGNEADKTRRSGMSEKAIEDQRKFREADQEESYFFDDVEDNSENYNITDVRNGMKQHGYRL